MDRVFLAGFARGKASYVVKIGLNAVERILRVLEIGRGSVLACKFHGLVFVAR
jgi:hypothetical protein